MRANYQTNATVQFRVLSDDQIDQIVLAALEVLERTGVRLFAPEAVDLLRQGGAQVSDDTLVKIPSWMVKAALATAPQRITMADRNGRRCMTLEPNRCYYGTGSDCPFILDADSGERRQFTYDDVAAAARIADALKDIDFFMSLGLCSDVPIYSYDVHQFLAMVSNTLKPTIVTAVSRDTYADIHRMCCAIAGSEEAFRMNPFMGLYAEPTSPLSHTRLATEKLLYSAEHFIPVVYTPCPIAAGTAPATMAGVLVLGLAECLSGLVMAQLKAPGAPVIMGGVVSILDLHTTVLSYGAPELHLLSAAFAEICRHVNMPMFSTCGCTDAKVLDEQAAIESALSTLAATLSGANLIHDIGFLEFALVGSYELMVMTDEIISMCKHIARGIEVNDDTLAVDVIHDVGPRGQYLDHEHTLRHFRKQFWFPRLVDRSNFETWRREGSKTYGDRARERVRDILKTHQPEPIAAATMKELKAIVAAADKREGARKR